MKLALQIHSHLNSIGEFVYNPEESVNFLSYYRRYKEIFKNDCQDWPDEKKYVYF